MLLFYSGAHSDCLTESAEVFVFGRIGHGGTFECLDPLDARSTLAAVKCAPVVARPCLLERYAYGGANSDDVSFRKRDKWPNEFLACVIAEFDRLIHSIGKLRSTIWIYGVISWM